MGGAGIQADIKTITRLKAHALAVVTAVTAQNSLGIAAIHSVPAKMISKQIETVLDDVRPHGIKIGMLMTEAAIRAVIRMIKRYDLSGIVLDPVLRASTGKSLLETGAIAFLKEALMPLTKVITPNLDEAGILAGVSLSRFESLEVADGLLLAFTEKRSREEIDRLVELLAG